jgi:hypothetical protein
LEFSEFLIIFRRRKIPYLQMSQQEIGFDVFFLPHV